MRKTLELRYNDTNDTIETIYSHCNELDTYIQGRIKPKNRVWSKNTNCWVVTPEVIGKVVYFSSIYFDEVNYFSLPPTLQEVVKEHLRDKKFTLQPTPTPQESNFHKLFLTEDAPLFLVRAAYKSLAKHYHPDNQDTGDKDRFMEISTAYKYIKK